MVNRFRRELPEEALHTVTEIGPTMIDSDTERSPHQATLYALGIRASIPMEVQGTTRGLLLIGERLQQRAMEEEDIEYLSSLANLAMIALENSRLLNEMIEKQRLE